MASGLGVQWGWFMRLGSALQHRCYRMPQGQVRQSGTLRGTCREGHPRCFRKWKFKCNKTARLHCRWIDTKERPRLSDDDDDCVREPCWPVCLRGFTLLALLLDRESLVVVTRPAQLQLAEYGTQTWQRCAGCGAFLQVLEAPDKDGKDGSPGVLILAHLGPHQSFDTTHFSEMSINTRCSLAPVALVAPCPGCYSGPGLASQATNALPG